VSDDAKTLEEGLDLFRSSGALTSVDETDDGQEDGLPRRGLEHHSLALTLAVQIHVRAVVLLLVL
jgi:hypothetical protein